MLRPMTVAPMFSNQLSTIGVLAFTSPPSSPCISRKAFKGNSQLIQLHPADPEGILLALLGTGCETVQRQHVQPELAHAPDYT
jgi:hypothetical protein